MEFHVKLIKAPSLNDLSGWDVFDLMFNARHVAGNYWIFEGDIESLLCGDRVSIIEQGTTDGFGDLNDTELLSHCHEIFGMAHDYADPAWKMLVNKSKE